MPCIINIISCVLWVFYLTNIIPILILFNTNSYLSVTVGENIFNLLRFHKLTVKFLSSAGAMTPSVVSMLNMMKAIMYTKASASMLKKYLE